MRLKGECIGWGDCGVEWVPGDRVGKGDAADSVHLSNPLCAKDRQQNATFLLLKSKA